MSSGQKAWAEEMEAEAEKEAANKFAKLTSRFIRGNIGVAYNHIKRVVESSPSLTRDQWFKLDKALEALEELR